MEELPYPHFLDLGCYFSQYQGLLPRHTQALQGLLYKPFFYSLLLLVRWL